MYNYYHCILLRNIGLLKARKGLLRKNIVAVSFFQNYIINHIFITHLYHCLNDSSIKKKIFFIYVISCPVNIHCIILTAQTDISLGYRAVLCKLISCLHFLKSIKCINF